jgi:hypothetical protein
MARKRRTDLYARMEQMKASDRRFIFLLSGNEKIFHLPPNSVLVTGGHNLRFAASRKIAQRTLLEALPEIDSSGKFVTRLAFMS